MGWLKFQRVKLRNWLSFGCDSTAPAVFPDVRYALTQIDELRAMVLQHFTHAAQVGAKVLAAQAQATEQEAKSSNAAAKDVKAPDWQGRDER